MSITEEGTRIDVSNTTEGESPSTKIIIELPEGKAEELIRLFEEAKK